MSKYNVILESIGENKVKIIQLYKNLTGADLKEAREKIDSAPCTLVENISESEADKIVLQLKGEGAKARKEFCEENEEKNSVRQEQVKEYEYYSEKKEEETRAKKAENTILGALEKISGFITGAVGIAAVILLLVDFNGLEGFTNGVVKIFTFLFIACLVWFCVLKRYVTYWFNNMENSFLYEEEKYDSEKFFDFLKNELIYEGMQKLKLDENGQCVVVCKFGTHYFEYASEERKMYVTYECSKKFPYYMELCNMIEANYIAKLLKDKLYYTYQAQEEKIKLDKLYRLHRLGKLTPLYIIIGIILLVGPAEIKKGIQTLRYPEIQVVKESELPILGEAPVQKILENFFGDPEWKFEKDSDGTGYVIFSGTAVQVSNDMVRDFEIYFRTKRIGDKEVQFEIQKITMEGEELSEADMLGILLLVNGEYIESTNDQSGMSQNVSEDDIQENTSQKSGESSYAEVTYFAGSYSDDAINVSISQWTDTEFVDLGKGELCASVTFTRGEEYLDAVLLKLGDNHFEIRDADGVEYYGSMYITEDYVDITDSGELGLDGLYALDYLYVS